MKCLYCGKGHNVSHNQRGWRYYCSKECLDNAKFLRRKCKNCGRVLKLPVIGGASTTKYCSRDCYFSWVRKQGGEKQCPNCGKIFHVGPVPMTFRVFCSRRCRYEGTRKNISCLFCGKVFKVPKRSKVKFCSTDCVGAYVKKINRTLTKKELSEKYSAGAEAARRPAVRMKIRLSKLGRKNPNWKPMVRVKCRVCGKKFSVKPGAVNDGRGRYCSKKCSRLFLSRRMKMNNPMRRKDVVKRCADTLRERYRNPDFKLNWLYHRTRHPNRFERKITRVIKKNGLPFRFVGDFSFWIGPCQSGKCKNPDFIHTNGEKKVVLANGRFWHSWKPALREEELSDYKSRGYDVLEVWDDEDNFRVLEKLRGFT